MAEATRIQSMTGCGTDFKQFQQMTDIAESLHHDQTVSIGSISFRIEDYFLHFINTVEKPFYIAVISSCKSYMRSTASSVSLMPSMVKKLSSGAPDVSSASFNMSVFIANLLSSRDTTKWQTMEGIAVQEPRTHMRHRSVRRMKDRRGPSITFEDC